MRSKHFANNEIAPCSCDWVQERLFSYLDGDLSLSAREQIQAHTETCSACAREVQNARQADLALHQAIRAVPAAGDLRSGFYAKLAQTEATPRVPRRWGWAVAMPAFAVGAIAIVLMRPAPPTANTQEFVSIDKSGAALPTVAATTQKQEKATLARKEIAPLAAVAKIVPPRAERLPLEPVTPTIRLTKLEIRRAGKSVIARANVPAQPPDSLSSLARARDTESILSVSNRSLQSNSPVRDEARTLSVSPPLEPQGPGNFKALKFDADSKLGALREQNQTVMRVASMEEAESDGESYLEVDDDTRNFSFSTRLASSQENGVEEFELSVSGDDPELQSEGADSR